MTYLVRSQISGEVLKEYELLNDAKEYADAGGFLRTYIGGKSTTEYPRRYVVDQDQCVSGAQIGDMLVTTQKVVYAKKDWPKLTEAELDEVLAERQKALDRQEGWINNFVYSTIRKT